MKTKLVTEFVCVATSGKTADGRTIEASHLQEMAKNYNKDTYTAQLWLEHYRYLGSNYGTVEALEARDQDGKVKLYAKIAPSKELLELNARGIGLFTSVEIKTPFADTNEAYLIGLAITDSPASLGTTQLNFSARLNESNVIIGEPEALTFNWQTEESEKEQARSSFFSWLFGKGKPPEEEKEESFEMTEKQMQAFAVSIAAAVVEQFKQTKTAEAVPAVKESEKGVETVTISAEEFSALKQENEETRTRLAELEQKFNTAVTAPVSDVPNGIAGVDAKFSVSTAI